MKKILVVLLIILAFAGGYFFSQKYNFKLEPKTSVNIISPTSQPLVGNDVDSHGCKGSAGYSWCEVKQKCLRVWEEPCNNVSVTPTIDESETIKSAIKQQLVINHGNSAEGLVITISTVNGVFARGMATEQGGGGMWLAKKIDESWKIIYEGNGAVDCQMIKVDYQFPNEMLTNFCD